MHAGTSRTMIILSILTPEAVQELSYPPMKRMKGFL